MEPIVEEKQDELKDIDEFFGWEEGKDEDEDGLYSGFKKLVRKERQNELSDHASDMIYDLKQLLSRIQTRASRYIINQQLSNHELIGSYKIFASHTAMGAGSKCGLVWRDPPLPPSLPLPSH